MISFFETVWGRRMGMQGMVDGEYAVMTSIHEDDFVWYYSPGCTVSVLFVKMFHESGLVVLWIIRQ